MTENDHALAAGAVFSGCKSAPNFSGRSQQAEQIGGDLAAYQTRRFSLSREIEFGVCGERSDFHRPALVLQGNNGTLGIELRHAHELVGSRVRQGPDERVINKAEHGGVAADPQREREHGHGREAGILAKLAKSEA
jgi:hypothetical protein